MLTVWFYTFVSNWFSVAGINIEKFFVQLARYICIITSQTVGQVPLHSHKSVDQVRLHSHKSDSWSGTFAQSQARQLVRYLFTITSQAVGQVLLHSHKSENCPGTFAQSQVIFVFLHAICRYSRAYSCTQLLESLISLDRWHIGAISKKHPHSWIIQELVFCPCLYLSYWLSGQLTTLQYVYTVMHKWHKFTIEQIFYL
jgi:hypothetical protein